MDWQLELTIALRAFVATLLGVLIGIEREISRRGAGIRTYAAVALGASAFSAISGHIEGADPSRIAANVVTGVGFLCAGVILRQSGRTVGLNTAAGLWATASVGMAVGLGMYTLGALLTALVILVMVSHRFFEARRISDPNDKDVGSD